MSIHLWLRKLGRRLTLGAVGMAFAGVCMLFLGSAAQASEGPYRLDACGAYSCGSATFYFASLYDVEPISESVSWAGGCAGATEAYLQFDVYNASGDNYLTKRIDQTCDGQYQVWNGEYANSDTAISKVQIRTCVTGGSLGTVCNYSGYLANPYY